MAPNAGGAPSGDLALLAGERAVQPNPMPKLIIAFMVSAAVGLAVTVLIGKLLG